MKKLCTYLYSWWIARHLSSCGKGFIIKFPSVINAPRSLKMGNNVTIAAHAWLNCEDRPDSLPCMEIGDGTSVGRFCHINARESVVLEKDVLLADKVFITDYHHEWLDPLVPVIKQGFRPAKPVRIGEGAWIGEGAVIMPGVTVGENAVVAANAVVTRDVPDNYIALGIPAAIKPKKGKD